MIMREPDYQGYDNRTTRRVKYAEHNDDWVIAQANKRLAVLNDTSKYPHYKGNYLKYRLDFDDERGYDPEFHEYLGEYIGRQAFDERY